MNRLFLVTIILICSTTLLSAQRGKVIGVFQLIEKEKFEEAKGIIEDAVKRKSTKKWSKTWYARGILCQEAYKKGKKDNKPDLYELYSDQLYVALFSFDRARYFDKLDRYDKILAPRYIILANELMELGNSLFNQKEYDEAFRAFEYAIRISKSTILTIDLDTNLIYNTALCAYKSKKWDQSMEYLTELNKYRYSPNVPYLMYSIKMKQNDTLAAQTILEEGIVNYNEKEKLTLLLVDLLYKKDEAQKAVDVLDDALSKDTANYIYPFTKGLLYQKQEDYTQAIEAYETSFKLPSDTLKIYTAIGTCYYNMGAGLETKARNITNNYVYREVKEQAITSFESSTDWFEKAFEIDNRNKEVITKLTLLYKTLDRKEALENLEMYTE